MGPHIIPVLEPHPATKLRHPSLREEIIKIFQAPCLRSVPNSGRLQRYI